MIRLLFLCSLLALLSPLLYCSDQFEGEHPFKWDTVLVSSVAKAYGNAGPFYSRLAQSWCESAFDPRATSDFKGWKKRHIDTTMAIQKGYGAAGVCQFIWETARRFGATTISTAQADGTRYAPDIYNPHWSIDAMCRYMRSIDLLLLRTKNPKARRRLQTDRVFRELCATAAYNTGEGRLLDRLRGSDDWEIIKYSILSEPREYAEKIQRIAKQMKRSGRWKIK